MADTTTASAAPAAATAPTAPSTPIIEAKGNIEAKVTEAPASEQKFTVKVDGKDVEVPLSELQKHYGLDKAATKRLQEAAAKEKNLNETLAKLKDDPDAYFKFVEKDPEEYAIKRLSEKHKQLLEQERIHSLSPEQRELEDLRAKLAEGEKEKERQANEQKTVKVSHAKQQIVDAVISTLETFPESYRKNDALALQVFATWEHAVENYEELSKSGVKLTPEYVRDQVLKSMRGLSGSFIGGSSDEEMDALIPKATMERITKKVRAQLAEEAKAAAHPSLTSEPQVRNGKTTPKDPPRRTPNQILRSITLGQG